MKIAWSKSVKLVSYHFYLFRAKILVLLTTRHCHRGLYLVNYLLPFKKLHQHHFFIYLHNVLSGSVLPPVDVLRGSNDILMLVLSWLNIDLWFMYILHIVYSISLHIICCIYIIILIFSVLYSFIFG